MPDNVRRLSITNGALEGTHHEQDTAAADPGEILATEFLEPLGVTQYRLAQAIHVPQTRIAAIVKDGRAITADTALRLARFFGTSEAFWLNLQSQYDADIARDAIEQELQTIAPFAMAA